MKKSLFITFVILLVIACKKDDSTTPTTTTDIAALKKEIAVTYSNIVYATYSDCYEKALILQSEIESFVADPTEEGLRTVREAWKLARIPYSQSDAFRFYGGPIDDANGPEGRLNAWPLDEAYIDYTESGSRTYSGIINDTENYPELSKESISNANEASGETDITIGYHAIEFLLWGQDKYADSPGRRPYTDYVDNTVTGTALNAARRGEYLKICVAILVDDLAYLKQQWEADGSYRARIYNSDSTSIFIGKFFDGLGKLSKGELAGERMTVAVASGDQEDEHSCFSDFTTTDIQNNFRGIKNVYLGSYTSTSGKIVTGKSLSDLVRTANTAADDSVRASLTRAELKMSLITNPFDQAILYDKTTILNAVNELKLLSDKIADAGFRLGYSVSTTLD